MLLHTECWWVFWFASYASAEKGGFYFQTADWFDKTKNTPHGATSLRSQTITHMLNSGQVDLFWRLQEGKQQMYVSNSS